MAEIIQGVHPTRSELLEIRSRIKLSKRGHKLLEEKRDAMIMEFFERIKKLKDLKVQLVTEMGVGYRGLIKAESVLGPSVDSLAMSTPVSLEVNMEMGNVMGVKIPKFVTRRTVRDSESEGFSSLRSVTLDTSIKDWDVVTERLFILIEAEEALKRLSEEIKSTKRRVNSLEYFMIPRLDATQKYIRARLEEQERENFFRLKTIKKKRGKAGDV